MDQRQFMRHPTEIPVEVRPADSEARPLRARDVSAGGLSFHSTGSLTLGAIVNLRISMVDPVFETDARVVWCREVDNGFDLGVAFLSAEDAFRARLVEQVCHIETYRRRLLEEQGRALTPEAAAREWIARFAASFPDVGRH